MHIDHVAGTAEARAAAGAELTIHAADQGWLAAPLPRQAEMFGFPARVPRPDRFHEDGEPLTLGDLSAPGDPHAGPTVAGLLLPLVRGRP